MKAVLSILLMSSVLFGAAQNDSGQVDMSKYQKVYMGDTAWVFVLKDLEKTGSDQPYRWMRHRVKKMAPFAEYAVELLTGIDEDVSDEKVTRANKKKAKKVNKKLKEDFRHTILDMSESDGDVLCKLIHRETGLTAYEIIKTYRGSAKALYWQGLAKLGGADLKQTFDPKKDVLLNRVMKDVEKGKIKVPEEPKMVTKQDRKDRKKKYRAKKKARKKKARDSKS